MIIREALDADWPDIYPIFRSIVHEGTTYAFPEDLSLDAGRAWWMEEPPGATVVAVDGEDVVGSAKMGPNRPGRGSHVATASFMVDPSRHGQGVGTQLGAHVIEWARASGYLAIQFNAVVAANEPAIHLWTKLGFDIVGTVPEAFDHRDLGLVGLHVMYRRV